MKIISTNVYVGPNIYAHFPVIRHVLDLGNLEDWPTGKLGNRCCRCRRLNRRGEPVPKKRMGSGAR